MTPPKQLPPAAPLMLDATRNRALFDTTGVDAVKELHVLGVVLSTNRGHLRMRPALGEVAA
jgi:hypothetical protein